MPSPDRCLHANCPGAILDGKEVNFRLTVIVHDGWVTWLINGVPVIASHGPGLAANMLVLDAIAGLPVKPQPPVDDGFERVYAIPVEAYSK